FVRHIGEAVVGILAAKVDRQASQIALALRLERSDVALERLHAERVFHRAALLAVQRLDDAPLEIHREAFVQPHAIPVRVRYEVARPGMRELMRDDRYEAAI